MLNIHKKNLKIDDRLMSCANFIRKDIRVLDIGTDHAYLPIYLALKEQIKSAIATDINIKPLYSAEMNIRKYHVEDTVKTRLSDGFETVFPNEADDIVIAGMGGETITNIMSQVSWIKNENIHLILQPMTMDEELRSFLKLNKYYVKDEIASVSSEKIYTTMLVTYKNGKVNDNLYFENIGKLSAENEIDREYIARKIIKYKKIILGLKHSSSDQYNRIQCFQDIIIGLEKILSEGK